MADVELRPIPAEETRQLRKRVLRPAQPVDELDYPGDEAPDTRHLGAYLDGELVGTASVYREPMPGTDAPQPGTDAPQPGTDAPQPGTDAPQPGADAPAAWRLRGMATLESVRRTGVGQSLLEACIAHAIANGGTHLWCNARSPARPFYQALGFQTEGEEFELPEIGPHYRMWRSI